MHVMYLKGLCCTRTGRGTFRYMQTLDAVVRTLSH